MKLIIFGITLKENRRLKADSDDYYEAVSAQHQLRVIPIDSEVERPPKNHELAELKRAINEGFVHIVLPPARDWSMVLQDVQLNCRVHNLRTPSGRKKLIWSEVKPAIDHICSLDETWLAEIAPRDNHSQLLLPPTFFRTSRHTANFWNICDAYSRGALETATRVLAKVEREHLDRGTKKAKTWRDHLQRLFTIDPSHHGISEEERNGQRKYRFCYLVPPGLHFDVSREDHGKFEVLFDRKSEQVIHCNVNPWGGLWRGKQ